MFDKEEGRWLHCTQVIYSSPLATDRRQGIHIGAVVLILILIHAIPMICVPAACT